MSRQADPDRADHVETRQRQWARELPDCDTGGMAILGRARWIALKVRPQIEAAFARHGIDTGEFDVLTTLLRAGAPYRLRPTELYTALMISSGGLTDRLTRLAKAGLVARVPSDSDARSLLVELTEKGRTLAKAAFREDMAIEAELLSGLDAEARTQLAGLLKRLALSVEEKL